MELQVTTMAGKKAKALTGLSENIFAVEYNEALIHQIVTAHLAGARRGTRAQKSRSEVSGSTAKPWRQKGTGRARAGTTRGPIWRKGGVTFAAKPQNYKQKVNRKMYRGAMCSILSELVRQERLLVVDEFKLESHKTKELADKLKNLALNNVLIITEELDKNLQLAAGNIPHVEVIKASAVDPVSLIGFEKVVITTAAIKQIEEVLA